MAASHDYWDQRDIADLVRDDILGLSPAEIKSRLGVWHSLLLPLVGEPIE